MSEETGSHAGRPSSWVTVGIMLTGFIIGGAALVAGPTWWLFAVGAAVVLLGGVFGLVVGIFSDVVVDEPRVIPEVVDYSIFGRRTDRRRGGEHGETIHKPTRREPEQTPHG